MYMYNVCICMCDMRVSVCVCVWGNAVLHVYTSETIHYSYCTMSSVHLRLHVTCMYMYSEQSIMGMSRVLMEVFTCTFG